MLSIMIMHSSRCSLAFTFFDISSAGQPEYGGAAAVSSSRSIWFFEECDSNYQAADRDRVIRIFFKQLHKPFHPQVPQRELQMFAWERHLLLHIENGHPAAAVVESPAVIEQRQDPEAAV